MKIHLLELLCHHGASGHKHRWYLSTQPGYQSRSTDDPAAVTWLPLVQERASVTVMVAGGRGGDTKAEVDALTLVNVRSSDRLPRWANVLDDTSGEWLRVPLGDRPLNALLTDYTVHEVTEKVVEAGAAYASAVTIWRAKAGIIRPGRLELSLPLFDRQRDFDAPVLVEKYAGTGGLEGPAELEGVTKERCWGHKRVVIPTYLGLIGGKHTYSVNGGHRIKGVPRGWDMAYPYALVASNPAAGQYSVDLATGIITVGGGATAKPTDFRAEVEGDMTGGVWRRTIGEVIAHLATTHGGLVGAADVSRMDATPRTIGVYLPAGDATTHRDLYARAVGSVARGHWYVDLAQADTLVVARLPAASTVTPERHYRADNGTSGLTPLPGADVVPAKQVTVRHAENPSPSTQTAAQATAEMVALWSQQWRTVESATDAAVAAAWGVSARVEPIDTLLTYREDAAAEAPLFLDELARPPARYRLPAYDGAPGLWIGDGVRVTDSVAGFETGGVAVIYGRSNYDRDLKGAALYIQR